MQQPSLDQSLQFSLCWGLSCLRSCSLLTCFRSNRQIKSPVPVLPNDAKHLRLGLLPITVAAYQRVSIMLQVSPLRCCPEPLRMSKCWSN